jgi:hypothetical protein
VSRQVAARRIRDSMRKQAQRQRAVVRATVVNKKPLKVELLDGDLILEDEEDFDVSATLTASRAKFAVGDTVLLHEEQGTYILFSVAATGSFGGGGGDDEPAAPVTLTMTETLTFIVGSELGVGLRIPPLFLSRGAREVKEINEVFISVNHGTGSVSVDVGTTKDASDVVAGLSCAADASDAVVLSPTIPFAHGQRIWARVVAASGEPIGLSLGLVVNNLVTSNT